MATTAGVIITYALLILCTAALSAEVQLGARFPLGVQVGDGGNCTQASEHGYIRFNADAQAVEVCRQAGWTEVGTEQAEQINDDLEDLQQRVSVLEGEIIPPLSLSQTNALLQSLVDAEYCNKRGEYNTETKLCSCMKTPQHGYWNDASFCTSCDAGYSGSTCQEDVNECSTGSHSCSPQHNCVNSVGSYDCVCSNGYQGDSSSCTDINECTEGTHACDPNAACSNTAGSYTCECNEGYNGNGYTCEEGPAYDLIASHGGWSFYKVPYPDILSAANVRTACLAAGLVPACPGDNACGFTDTSQCTVTSEVGCGSPMGTTSNLLCGTHPGNCPALNFVYIYMKNWNGGAACGVYNGGWCDNGITRTPGGLFAFCAKQD